MWSSELPFLKAGLLVLKAKRKSEATNLGFFALAFTAGMNVAKFISKIEDLVKRLGELKKAEVQNYKRKMIRD